MTSATLWTDALTFTGIAFGAYVLAMWAALIAWTYRDISSRTIDSNQRLVAVGTVTFFSLPGLLLYLALRPSETLVEGYNRQLEAEAFLHDVEQRQSCATCRRTVGPDFVACPYCRATLQEACSDCGRNLQTAWTICPYCAHERTAAQVASPWTAKGGVAVKPAAMRDSRNGHHSGPQPLRHADIMRG